MAVLLITHDLGVVANMADEVVVVYHGKLMERGTLEDIFDRPGHPYLQALMRAVPRMGMEPGERLTPIREMKRDTGGHLGSSTGWPDGADAAGPSASRRSGARAMLHSLYYLAIRQQKMPNCRCYGESRNSARCSTTQTVARILPRRPKRYLKNSITNA